MELMTREMEGKLKSFPFYSQDGKGDDAIVVMKFFNPYGGNSNPSLSIPKTEKEMTR